MQGLPGMSPRVVKHASDKQVTYPPGSQRQEMFLMSLRHIWVSLPTNFVLRFKVSKLAKLRGIEGTCHTQQ